MRGAALGMSVSAQTPAGVVLAPRRFPRIAWSDRSGTHQAYLKKRMVVGASGSADLVIDDVTVSRIHAELEPRDEGLWVRDLSSRNGTFINGNGIRESVLRSSGEITVGTTSIIVDYSNAVSAPVELWSGERFHRMVGQSKAMRELFALIARIAPTDASILINGETGTGKEVVARSIHEASLRKNGPFVIVDCAALPENLLDAELFGHTKGAFTGAAQARVGAIEAADGGTVFLDEIGELPIAMQPKLLRVLEQRTFRRIGESVHRPVNVRFVSATHRDLLSMVSRGEVREDLYFRLCVLPVRVPPLRDRREDIPSLVEHFLDGEQLSEELIASLTAQTWRGNVRELRNYVERTLALGEQTMDPFVSSGFTDEEIPTSQAAPRTSATMPPPGTSGLPTLVDDSDDLDGGTPAIGLPSVRGFGGTSSFSSSSVRSLSAHLPREAQTLLSETETSGSVAPAPEVPPEGDFRIFRERWIDRGEREYLVHMLARHDRNVASLAREACVNRTYIYRLMRKHGL
jgi:DNA-binding NtrC family response regulator